MTTPAAAAVSRAAVTSPVKASKTTATTGIPSFTKLFHTPETIADRAISGVAKPHDVYMAYVTPTPIAPPAGSVLETAVEA